MQHSAISTADLEGARLLDAKIHPFMGLAVHLQCRLCGDISICHPGDMSLTKCGLLGLWKAICHCQGVQPAGHKVKNDVDIAAYVCLVARGHAGIYAAKLLVTPIAIARRILV